MQLLLLLEVEATHAHKLLLILILMMQAGAVLLIQENIFFGSLMRYECLKRYGRTFTEKYALVHVKFIVTPENPVG